MVFNNQHSNRPTGRTAALYIPPASPIIPMPSSQAQSSALPPKPVRTAPEGLRDLKLASMELCKCLKIIKESLDAVKPSLTNPAELGSADAADDVLKCALIPYSADLMKALANFVG